MTSDSGRPWTAGAVMRFALGVDRRRLVGASILLVIHEIGEASVPVVFGLAIDAGISTGDAAVFGAWLVALAGVFLALSLSWRFGGRWAHRVELNAQHALRLAVVARMLDPRSTVEVGHPGSVLTTATSDARRVAEIPAAAIYAIGWIGAVLFATATLLTISVPLGIVVIVGAPPVLLLLQAFAAWVERRSVVEQAEAASAASLAVDFVRGRRVLHGIGAEAAAAERYRTASGRSMRAVVATATAYAWHGSVTVVVTGLFLLGVTGLAAGLAATGQASIGGLIAGIGLTAYLLDPLASIADLGARYAGARASAARIATVLSAPVALHGGGRSPATLARGDVRFRAVVDGPLDGLDLAIPAGSRLGLATHDPTAAAAAIDLLARARDPRAGTIELDGTSVAAIDPDGVRRAILVADHDAELFPGTLGDNVRLPETDPAMAAAAMTWCAVDEIARRRDGLATDLGDRGQQLSGGERQRVALARAVAMDPPVLVLHDPTTAIDAVTGIAIADAVLEARRDRTTIVVTSDPLWLARCDRVVVLRDGRVAADGPADGPGVLDALASVGA